MGSRDCRDCPIPANWEPGVPKDFPDDRERKEIEVNREAFQFPA